MEKSFGSVHVCIYIPLGFYPAGADVHVGRHAVIGLGRSREIGIIVIVHMSMARVWGSGFGRACHARLWMVNDIHGDQYLHLHVGSDLFLQ